MSAQFLIEQLLRSGAAMIGQRGLGSGAAAGGVLGLLLGSRRGAGFGSKALRYGSVAAIGALAYRAYTEWQRRQALQQSPDAPLAAAPRPEGAALPSPGEDASRALITAMIGTAKSHGHLDERERGLLEAQLARVEGADPALRAWLEAEIARPLDPAQVAQAASSPELASQMYLASLLVADETSFMERTYLDELARQLKLPDGLKAELESQAQAA